jgi:hypothetical protein
MFQIFVTGLSAQVFITDTTANGKSFIHKDERVDLLGAKMTEYYESLSKKIQLIDGYRLLVVNTSDRSIAMQTRSDLIKTYPDQKLYMSFLAPNIKIKLGNFTEREEAEKFREVLVKSNLISGNIYIVPEKVEQKSTAKKAEEEQ